MRNKQPLWFWGFVCIVAAIASGPLIDLVKGPPNNRAEMLGRGIGQLLGIGIGIVLIIVHFVRRR